MKKLILLFLVSSLAFSSQLNKEMYAMGEELYKDTCISCHGIDGKAKTDMKLVVKPRDLSLTLLDEEQTYLITRDGAHHWGAKADIMPSFKHVYNEEQLRAIAHFITQKFNPNLDERIKKICTECEKEPVGEDAKLEKWGKKIYKRNCQFCHGITGKGDGVATTSPVDSIFPYDLTKTLLTKKQVFLYVKYGGKKFGTDKEDMPSWSRKYNDFKLRAVAKYVDEVLKEKQQ